MSDVSLLISQLPDFHKSATHPCWFAAFHKSAEHTFCFYFLHNETAWFCQNRRHQAEYQPCVTGLFSAEYREKMGVFRAIVASSQTKIRDAIGANSLQTCTSHPEPSLWMGERKKKKKKKKKSLDLSNLEKFSLPPEWGNNADIKQKGSNCYVSHVIFSTRI